MAHEKPVVQRLPFYSDEDSLLDFFFVTYNGGQMCSDIIYDVKSDRILHVSLDFEKLTGNACSGSFNHCLQFIKNLIHPEDYSDFLVSLVEFVKLGHPGSSSSCSQCIRSFSFRVRVPKNDWQTIELHTLMLESHKLVGVIHRQTKAQSDESASVSAREKEILHLIAGGDSAKIIGNKLNISPNTVITHRNNLKKKFRAKNTAELIKEAVKSQVI